MITRYKNVCIIILTLFISVYLASCAVRKEVSQTEKSDSLEEQTEQDILKLLGVEEGEKEDDPSISGIEGELGKKVTELEKMVYEKNSEINELKSELVLKDERIDVLQAKVRGTGKKGTSSGIKADYAGLYQTALNNYYSQKYREAIRQFNNLLAMDMNTNLSDNCQYWIGECYYALKDFKKAIVEFEKVFTFTKNNKEDDAQLKLGLCYINLRDKERALAELNRLLTNYPKSEYIPKAKGLLSDL